MSEPRTKAGAAFLHEKWPATSEPLPEGTRLWGKYRRDRDAIRDIEDEMLDKVVKAMRVLRDTDGHEVLDDHSEYYVLDAIERIRRDDDGR